MSAVQVADTRDMSRQEWLDFRRKGIGGSDAAAILGLSPWASPLDVYLSKTGELPTESDEPSDAMRFGSILEDIVAQEFSRRTGLKVRRRNAMLQHKDYPFMLANLDRRIVGGGILECKTANAFTAGDWADGVPEHYMCQVQHYLAVTGEKFAYIAVLIGGQKFEFARIERDEPFISTIIDYERTFWHDNVLAGKAPEIDGSESAGELLKQLFPQSNKATINLPASALELITQYEVASADEKDAKARKDAAGNKLKMMLGENEIGLLGDRRIKWSTVTKNGFDGKAFEQAYPELHKEFIKQSTYRRFDVR